MPEGEMKRMADLVLLVWDSGYYQECRADAPGSTLKLHESRTHLKMILPEGIVSRLVSTVKATLRTGVMHRIPYALAVGANLEYFQAKAIPVHQHYALLLLENVTESEEKIRTLDQQNDLRQLALDNVTTRVSVYDCEGNCILQNSASSPNDAVGVGREGTGSEKAILRQDGSPLEVEELPLARAFRGEAVLN